jgi:hypothetical protein
LTGRKTNLVRHLQSSWKNSGNTLIKRSDGVGT